jgi:light-independent protochlorophyllide reductase subunit B
MGFEGANVIFDTWVHPLVMGLEEHLLTMFRDDFEFSDAAGASHLGGHGASAPAPEPQAASADTQPEPTPAAQADVAVLERPVTDADGWTPEGVRELQKIPFFVRGKAKRNTERYAAEKGLAFISVETLYEAKAHYAR